MSYQHFDFGFDRATLIDVYHTVRCLMAPLSLDRSFRRLGYHHDQRTNPNWLDLEVSHHPYIAKMISRLDIDGLDHVISISELPPGYALGPHRDVGRKSVLIVPIIGYEEPVYFHDNAVYYNDQCVLIDGSQEHWVTAQESARVGIQFSFKKPFATMKQHFDNITQKVA